MTDGHYVSTRSLRVFPAAPTACFRPREQGIRAVELLVLQHPSTGPKDVAEALLLKRFLGTMDLGWHAAVQPDGETEPGSLLLRGSYTLFLHQLRSTGVYSSTR